MAAKRKPQPCLDSMTCPHGMDAVNASAGAESYRLDVATDVGFTSFVLGYQNRTVNALVRLVSGLTAETNYYYRVRAVIGATTSANSNTITTTTPPVI